MTTAEEVIAIVAQVLGVEIDALTAETSMEDVKEWDSLHNMMILTKVQKSFGIAIPVEDVFDLVSIGALVDEVEKLKGDK